MSSVSFAFDRRVGVLAFWLGNIIPRLDQEKEWYKEAKCALTGAPILPLNDACMIYDAQNGYRVVLRESLVEGIHEPVETKGPLIAETLKEAYACREATANAPVASPAFNGKADDVFASGNGSSQLGNLAAEANGDERRNGSNGHSRPSRTEQTIRHPRQLMVH